MEILFARRAQVVYTVHTSAKLESTGRLSSGTSASQVPIHQSRLPVPKMDLAKIFLPRDVRLWVTQKFVNVEHQPQG